MSLTRSMTMHLARARLAASVVILFGGILAAVLFLVALFSNRHEFGTAALVALIASMLGMATAAGLSAYVLVRSGSWTTLEGRQTSREEQPAKFATWVTFHGVVAAIWTTAAGFLIWSMLAV